MRRLALLALLFAAIPTLAQDTPLPSESPTSSLAGVTDIPTLLHQVEAHQRAAEAAQRDYLYRVTATRIETDSHGRPKKTTTTVADSLTLRGIRVNRLLSRNGQPLSPVDQQKENARIDKEVDKANDRLRRAAASGKPVTPNGEDEITVSRLLQLGTFSGLRREIQSGRPTLILDFTGDPHAKTHSASEGLLRDLAGTIWIDQQDRAITRIQGHAVADFHVGLGLVADLKKGTSFSVQNVKVNNEVWLPAQIDAQGSLRYLLFFSFTGQVRILCSDYRKFQTTTTILPLTTQTPPKSPPSTTPEPQENH